jgi:hypothetical protein
MPTTNSLGPKRAILHASVSTEEQARTGFSFHQLIKTIEQLPAPSSIRGTEGQHRNKKSLPGPGAGVATSKGDLATGRSQASPRLRVFLRNRVRFSRHFSRDPGDVDIYSCGR